MKLFVAALSATLALAATAGATTYPVGASRTYHSPCLLAAAVTLQPGDIVEVDPGTYTDACQLTASGTEQAPIVLRASPVRGRCSMRPGSISAAAVRFRARSSSGPTRATGRSRTSS